MSIDKAQFNESIPLKAVVVETAKVSSYLHTLEPWLLNRARISNIADTGDLTTRLLLLNPSVLETMPNDLIKAIDDLKLVDHSLDLSYDTYNVFDILDQLLPTTLSRNLVTIGKCVYVNLSSDLLAYKEIIGQVVLEKMDATSVVAFIDREVEVLAGSSDLQVELTERDA
jgi:tRNA G37 N-methylase Trm5